MERVTIHGLDGVSGAKAGLVGRRPRLHFMYSNGVEQQLRQQALVAGVKLLDCRGGNMKAQLQGCAAALDCNGDGLVGVQLVTVVDVFPVGLVYGVEVADDVAGFEAGLGRRGAWGDPFHGGGFDFIGGTSLSQPK